MNENNNNNTDTVNDSTLMEDIMSELNNGEFDEKTVESETNGQAEVVEASTQNDVVEEEAAVVAEPTAENEGEVVTSEPTTNGEVNKSEAIKALKAKVKELSQELAGKKETTEEDSAEVKEDALSELASLLGHNEEDIKQLIKNKKAESQGMTPEVMDKFDKLNSQLETLNAEKQSKAEEAKVEAIAETIDSLADQGISTEEDVKLFFEKAKNEYGIDLTVNPNSKTALALLKGGLGDSFKETVEQSALQKIKDGEIAEVTSNEQETLATKEKQEMEKFNNAVDKMMELANKQLGR